MPTSVTGKAIASRNATTHGLFARDVVLPALGEDPEGYRQLEAEWMAQLPPRTLLERHYVEKIAAASWRLRRLHRWQAQLFEDDTLAEHDRLDRLDRAMRHETALHRQIDTAVKMLHRDAPQLFAQRAREQVQEDLRLSERECREDFQDGMAVDLEVQNRLSRIRRATEQAVNELSKAPLDARTDEICENKLMSTGAVTLKEEEQRGDEAIKGESAKDGRAGGEVMSSRGDAHNCENEPLASHWNPSRLPDFLDPKRLFNAQPGADRREPRRKALSGRG